MRISNQSYSQNYELNVELSVLDYNSAATHFFVVSSKIYPSEALYTELYDDFGYELLDFLSNKNLLQNFTSSNKGTQFVLKKDEFYEQHIIYRRGKVFLRIPLYHYSKPRLISDSLKRLDSEPDCKDGKYNHFFVQHTKPVTMKFRIEPSNQLAREFFGDRNIAHITECRNFVEDQRHGFGHQVSFQKIENFIKETNNVSND